jgi:DNA-binding phage protein
VHNIQAEIRRMMKEGNVSFYGMAKATGVDRGSLYKSLKDGSNLELNTMMKVLNYLGYEIRLVKSRRKEVKPIKPKRSTAGANAKKEVV